MANKIVAFEIEINGTKRTVNNITEVNKAIKDVNKALAETADASEYDRLREQLIRLKATAKEAAAQERALIKEAQANATTAEGSYKRLDAQLTKLKLQYQQLGAAQREGAEGKALLNQIDQLDKKLKKLDASTGNFQRNVGNYPREFGKLGKAAKNLGPAFEALGISFNSALGPLGLLLGAVQLFQFAVDSILPVLSAWFDSGKSIVDIQKELIGSIVEETADLQQLTKVATDENTSKEDRATAIALINERYGDYLPNLLTEESTLNEITAAQQAATRAIIDNIVNKAKQAAIQEKINRSLELELRTQRDLEAIEKFRSEGRTDQAISRRETRIAEAAAEQRKINEDIKNISRQYNAAALGLAEAFQGVDISAAGTVDIASETRKRLRKEAEEIAKAAQEQAKQQAAAAKKAQDEARRAFERRLEEQRRANEEAIKNEEATIKIILDLQIKLQQQQINNIKDSNDKARAQALFDFERRKAEIKNQGDQLAQAAAETEDKLVKAFGAGSKEVQQFRQKNAAQQVQAEQQRAALLIEVEKQYQATLIEIQEQADERQLQEIEKQLQEQRRLRDALFATELSDIERREQLKNLVIDEQLAQRLKATTDAEQAAIEQRIAAEQKAAVEIEAIKQRAAILSAKEAEISLQRAFGADVAAEEFQKIALERQQLQTRLAQIEAEQTALVKNESAKREAARKKELETGLKTFQEGLQLTSQFFDALSEREIKKQTDRATAQQAEISALQKRLEGAVGLEKRFLEQRVQAETQALARIEAEREAAEKQARKRQKAVAIIDSLVRGALAVTGALAAPPFFPLNAPAVATAAGIAAAQTAIIAAKPLAQGGYTGSGTVKDGTGYKVAGVVHEGEWVAPKWMVSSRPDVFAGLESSRKARRFAIGGFTGPIVGSLLPPQAPPTTRITDAISTQTAAIKSQKVILDTDELARFETQKSNIKKASLL